MTRVVRVIRIVLIFSEGVAAGACPRSNRHEITAMPTIREHCRSVPARHISMRWPFLAAVLTLWAMIPAGTGRAQDGIQQLHQEAKTWARHRIAVIQAASGDVLGAKKTVWEIDEDAENRPAEVTAVWFCNGQPIYDHSPMFTGECRCNCQQDPRFVARDRAAVPAPPASVPPAARPSLPSNYLAPDPRHGAIVGFTDEYDVLRHARDFEKVCRWPRGDRNAAPQRKPALTRHVLLLVPVGRYPPQVGDDLREDFDDAVYVLLGIVAAEAEPHRTVDAPSGTLMAFSTCDGSSVPEVQAEPLDAQMP